MQPISQYTNISFIRPVAHTIWTAPYLRRLRLAQDDLLSNVPNMNWLLYGNVFYGVVMIGRSQYNKDQFINHQLTIYSFRVNGLRD